MVDELFEIVVFHIPVSKIKEVANDNLFKPEDIAKYYVYDEKQEKMLLLEEIPDFSDFLGCNPSTIWFIYKKVNFGDVELEEVGVFFDPITLPQGKFVDLLMNFKGRAFFSFNRDKDTYALKTILREVLNLSKKTTGEKVTFGLDGSFRESDDEVKLTTLLELRDISDLEIDFSKCLDFVYNQLSIE